MSDNRTYGYDDPDSESEKNRKIKEYWQRAYENNKNLTMKEVLEFDFLGQTGDIRNLPYEPTAVISNPQPTNTNRKPITMKELLEFDPFNQVAE